MAETILHLKLEMNRVRAIVGNNPVEFIADRARICARDLVGLVLVGKKGGAIRVVCNVVAVEVGLVGDQLAILQAGLHTRALEETHLLPRLLLDASFAIPKVSVVSAEIAIIKDSQRIQSLVFFLVLLLFFRRGRHKVVDLHRV